MYKKLLTANQSLMLIIAIALTRISHEAGRRGR